MNEKDKAIIFDVGGVLLDYDRNELLSNISQKCNDDTYSETVASLIGRLELSKGLNTPRTFYDELKEKHGLSLPFEYLAEYWVDGLSSRAWVPDLLSGLSTRATLIILSDTNALHWDHIKDNILDLDLFSYVFVSHQSGMMKDSRDIFDLVIGEVGFRPTQLLFIDDTISNTIHASESGMATHHFKDQQGMLAAINEHLGTYVPC
jgi:putative hydrolase of the HAD superfamily